jgi:hypothetical protein
MAALSDLLPELAHAYQATQNQKQNLKLILERAGMRGRTAAAVSRAKTATPKPEIKKPSHNPLPLVTPAHARPFDNGGKTMLSPQQLAGISSKTDEVARLSDK